MEYENIEFAARKVSTCCLNQLLRDAETSQVHATVDDDVKELILVNLLSELQVKLFHLGEEREEFLQSEWQADVAIASIDELQGELLDVTASPEETDEVIGGI
jgi:hypothetical protein